ncbi:MAG: glycosyltransferase family 2 protein [Candidatus Omnitrophota bacterium]|nr:glycosyltransferase family 2 protein [Candidatus Omnitrophota bacterium]
MDNDKKIQSLSVIIPAFNEEEIIEESILLLYDKLKNNVMDYEIIVVDDGSNDETSYIARQLSLVIKDLKLINNHTNQGYGSALRKGFSIASKELVFYTDADLPIDYEEIFKAETILRETGSDFIAGFRYNRTVEPIYRIIYSFVYNCLISFLFGVKVTDINFSFKLFKRGILEKLNLESEGLFIDAEMIVKATYLGYKIKEFGTAYFPRKTGYSTLGRPRAVLKTLCEIIKYYQKIKEIKK